MAWWEHTLSRGSGRGLVSGEGVSHSEGRVEHCGALVDDSLYATTPHVRRQSLNLIDGAP